MIQIKSGRFLIILLFLLASSLVSHAQTDTSKVFEVNDGDTVYLKPTVPASFTGGQHGWVKFLQKTLNPDVPVNNGAPNGTYRVVMRFLVRKDGSISDITPESKMGYGMEKEVTRMLLKSPAWIPATPRNCARPSRMQPAFPCCPRCLMAVPSAIRGAGPAHSRCSHRR